MIKGPKDFADKAYDKWGAALDTESDGIVEEMQADMMVLIGIIYGMCLPDDIAFDAQPPKPTK